MKISALQLQTVWGFLYPFAKHRAESTHTLLDDVLVESTNRLLQQDKFAALFVDIINGEKPQEALQLEAGPLQEDIELARYVAGGFDYISGMVQDCCRAMHASSFKPSNGCGMQIDTAEAVEAAKAAETNAANKTGVGSAPATTTAPAAPAAQTAAANKPNPDGPTK